MLQSCLETGIKLSWEAEGGKDQGARGRKKGGQDQIWGGYRREAQRAKRMNGNKQPQGVEGGGTL